MDLYERGKENKKIPDGWNEKKLKEISYCYDHKRKPLNKKERQKMKGSIPYYGANGVVDYVNDYLFDEDLILLAEDGGNFFEYTEKKVAYKISGKSWVNNHAHVLKNNAETDFHFLYYSLEHKDIRRYVNGTTRLKLNKQDMLNIRLLVPPLEEQQKIASILSTWDEAIKKYQNLLEHELLYRRELGRKVFNYDFFKKKDPKSKLYRISEVSYSVSGRPLEKYVRNEGKYKFISIGNYSVTGKYIDDGKRIILNEVTKKRVLNKNDLVMVLNDKTKEGNIIGTCLLIDEDERYIYNQRTQRIIVDSYKVLPVFMYYLLNSQLVKSQIFARSQGGTQIYVNYSEVEKIKVPIPSIEIQKTISSLMMLSDKKISSIQNMITQLQEQKRGLMQLLLTGKVRV